MIPVSHRNRPINIRVLTNELTLMTPIDSRRSAGPQKKNGIVMGYVTRQVEIPGRQRSIQLVGVGKWDPTLYI